MAPATLNTHRRQPIKQHGRNSAFDELRKTCIARVREGREQLLNKLRQMSDEDGFCSGAPRSFIREMIQTEVMDYSAKNPSALDNELGLSEEALIELEAEVLRELELHELVTAERQAENMLEEENEADCALYEQHMLGGVPCPLCGEGRLFQEQGELRCTSCSAMRAAMMDESLTMEEVSEILGTAEDRHWGAGCSARANFEVVHDYGQPVLFLQCTSCGWHEVVL